jgi:hypothetical protein
VKDGLKVEFYLTSSMFKEEVLGSPFKINSYWNILPLLSSVEKITL